MRRQWEADCRRTIISFMQPLQSRLLIFINPLLLSALLIFSLQVLLSHSSDSLRSYSYLQSLFLTSQFFHFILLSILFFCLTFLPCFCIYFLCFFVLERDMKGPSMSHYQTQPRMVGTALKKVIKYLNNVIGCTFLSSLFQNEEILGEIPTGVIILRCSIKCIQFTRL